MREFTLLFMFLAFQMVFIYLSLEMRLNPLDLKMKQHMVSGGLRVGSCSYFTVDTKGFLNLVKKGRARISKIN